MNGFDLIGAIAEHERIERRVRRLLRKCDCRLTRAGWTKDGPTYYAVSRTTGSVEMGPLDLDSMDMLAVKHPVRP